ncbi:MAG: GxxExxY protein [Planctomycetaceae bacterium]|nr:GxxExxY protein [Planctomycetaceae bacterium]
MLLYEDLTHEIYAAAIEVHKALGPGLLESTYEACLCHELHLRNVAFKRQLPLAVIYKDVKLDAGYVIDVLVDDRVILEIKSVEKLASIHEAQLMTYLKLSGLHLGLLMNFNTVLMKDGIKRIVH